MSTVGGDWKDMFAAARKGDVELVRFHLTQAGYEVAQGPDAWSDVPPLLGDFPPWALEMIKDGL